MCPFQRTFWLLTLSSSIKSDVLTRCDRLTIIAIREVYNRMKRVLLLGIAFFVLVAFALYGQTVTIQPGDILYHPAAYAGDTPLIFRPFAMLDDGTGAFGHVGLVDWNYKVIEAKREGVVRHSITDFVSRYASGPDPFVYLLRVKASQAVINNAIYFAIEQLGKPYDPVYVGKVVFATRYYCSELVWAAYEYASGAHYDSSGRLVYGYINLDAGDATGYVTPGLVVTPNEIFRSSWVYTVARRNLR